MANNARRHLHPSHQNRCTKLSDRHCDDAEDDRRCEGRVHSSGSVIVFTHTQVPGHHNVCTDGEADTECDNQTDDRYVGTDGRNGLVRNKMSENSNVCKVVKLLENTGQG